VLSIVFGSAFEVPNEEPDLAMARNYRANGRNLIGHDSHDIVHVCDKACAETVIREAGNYVQCTNNESTFVSFEETKYTDGKGTGHYPTADVHDFSPGDDPYVLCGACGETLLRDDDAFEAMFGHKIGES
jgi:hypothetical protein